MPHCVTKIKIHSLFLFTWFWFSLIGFFWGGSAAGVRGGYEETERCVELGCTI